MNQRFEAVVMSLRDNCATLLVNAHKGQKIHYLAPDTRQLCWLELSEDIAFAHKVALNDIPKGSDIIKYGEVIGVAASDILHGQWVHVHNVESKRARGDIKDASDKVEHFPQDFFADVRNHSLVLRPALLDASRKTFMGYPRPDGQAGTRNYVGVISCVACANDVVARLGNIEGVACFTHQQGCSQTKPDVDSIAQILINLAKNPNLGAVIYVSLGCESVPSQAVAQAVEKTGKPVKLLVIQKEGGLTKTLEKAQAVIEDFKKKIAMDPMPVSFSKLRLGLKCGSSDTTQGLSANVVCGKVTEIFAHAQAQVVMGETTEFMGAEHIAARHAADPAVAAAIVQLVERMEARAKAVGVDMRGGQPTRGNIAGGLTTIEEKSLGALAKAGSAVFQAVATYGQRSDVSGLVMMDAPGREPEMLTGLAAAGCNLILFTTGRGAPQGFPFVPVVKVTGNASTFELMAEHMDACVSGVMTGNEGIESAGKRLFEELMEFADGKPTKAELCHYNNSMNIYVTGPVI